MTANAIRPFLRTLSCFSTNARRCFSVNANLKRQNNYANLLSSIKSDRNLRFRYFCSNSSQAKDKLDIVEKNTPVEDGSGETVKIYFKNFYNEVFEINAKTGQSVLEAAKDGGLDMPGACVGQLTCTTCHVYVDESCGFLLENISIQEDDMLDKAPFLKENSRLSCQIMVTKELEGKTFILPKATRNFAVDGYVFEQH